MNNLEDTLKISLPDKRDNVTIFIAIVKELLPNIYESGKEKNWSDLKIVLYAFDMRLPAITIGKFLLLYERYQKIAVFS
jgi:hypothetical protein